MSDWRAVILLFGLTASAPNPDVAVEASQGDTQPGCVPSSPLVRVAALPEGSGIAASRRSPGVLWAHNDSGPPVLFALDQNGGVTRSLRVEGARVDDWEDVAVGPCPQGTCVYIADIGDNRGSRERITLYRVPEPSAQDTSTRAADAFQATYPDGAHDAEALFVTQDAGVYILTKGDPGPVALYRFPRPLKGGTTMRLERIGLPLAEREVDSKDRPTGADASSDGRWIAFRTTHWLEVHRAADFVAGGWRAVLRFDLSDLREPRGEGVTLGRDGPVFLVGEGRGSAGTVVKLVCPALR